MSRRILRTSAGTGRTSRPGSAEHAGAPVPVQLCVLVSQARDYIAACSAASAPWLCYVRFAEAHGRVATGGPGGAGERAGREIACAQGLTLVTVRLADLLAVGDARPVGPTPAQSLALDP